VATKEQLPPLPLPRTVKLNTPPIKAYKEWEANQDIAEREKIRGRGRMVRAFACVWESGTFGFRGPPLIESLKSKSI